MRKKLCFYVGYTEIFHPDSGELHEEYRYGSEIALISLAKELHHLYDIYICGTKYENETKIDIFHIIPINMLNDSGIRFDTMIIWRYVNFFIFCSADVADKILFWVHDERHISWFRCEMLPDYSKHLVHNTSHLIHKIVVLSDWHKHSLQKLLSNVCPSKFHIIGNAIPQNFVEKVRIAQPTIQRYSNRFIWTSDFERGLDKLIDFFPTIRQYLPDAELHVFRKLTDIPTCNHPYIVFRGYKSNDEIINEFMQSEFWFYPTEYNETFCISALEAQLCGCYVISSNSACLPTTVGDRGIVIEHEVYSDEFWQQSLDEILRYALMPKSQREQARAKAFKWAHTQTWRNKAQEWLDIMDNNQNIYRV